MRTETDNPLRSAYWLGETDPRPLSLFRIGFGCTLLHDLADYAFELRAFVSDEGMLPRGASSVPMAWSAFDLVGSLPAVAALFAVGCLAVTAFTLGYRTRLSTLVSWLFLTSLHTRNLYVTDGGDDLARIMLFGLLFTDAGRAYSLDVKLGRKAFAPVPALGLRFLQWHLAFLYFQAGRLKIRHGWFRSNSLYSTLQLDGFVRPLGSALARSPLLCRALGVMTPVLEVGFAFAALSPLWVARARAVAIACGLAVQLGILTTMKVGVFTETLIWAMALFLRGTWIDAAETWLNEKGWLEFHPRPPAATSAGPERAGAAPPRRLRAVAFAFLATLFIAQAWGHLIGSRIRAPSALDWTLNSLWLRQPMGLFDIIYDIPTWAAPGVEQDGAQVEVLEVAAPGIRRGVGIRYSRWYKFTFKEREHPFRWSPLGRYLCRAYAEQTGRRLRRFTLVETLTPPYLPASPRSPSRSSERFSTDCP